MHIFLLLRTSFLEKEEVTYLVVLIIVIICSFPVPFKKLPGKEQNLVF